MAGQAMAQRFSVIQGGLSDRAPAGDAGEAAPGPGAAWRVDLHRPGALDGGAMAAWRALMARGAIDDPLRDPDHLLPLAQHRPGGARVAVALAWSREAEGPETLRGVVPLAMPHPVWGRRAALWRPAEARGTALIDGTAADAVETALRGRLRALRRPVGLAGGLDAGPAPGHALVPTSLVPASLSPDTSGRNRLALVASRPARRPVPAHALVGVRPAGWTAQDGLTPPDAEIEEARAPAAVRDAVEAFLALDARVARRPIVADPSEASLVRVVTRLFARRGAMRVELVRRAGALVAGTLHLGLGPSAVAWRRARA